MPKHDHDCVYLHAACHPKAPAWVKVVKNYEIDGEMKEFAVVVVCATCRKFMMAFSGHKVLKELFDQPCPMCESGGKFGARDTN